MEMKESAIIPVLILMLFTWSVSSDTYSEFGVTNIKESSKLTLQYTWMIHNFKLSTKPDNDTFFLQSPEFGPPGNESFKWFLRLYPAKSSVGIYLIKNSSSTIAVNDTFTIGSKKKSYVDTFKGTKPEGWPTFMDRSVAINSCLPNGSLVVKCEISTLSNIVASTEINVDPYSSTKNKVNKSKLPDELLTLLEDEKFSDITILLDDNEIRAHRIILALRSPVFASLLEENRTESNCNRNSSILEIKDVKPKIFKKLLHYIYTDKVDSIDSKIAKDLLVAAIKYDVKGLKVICEEFLYNSINVDNAIEILDITDQYHIPVLKSRVMKFAGEHAIFLIHSSAFKSLEQSKLHLLYELLVSMIPCKANV
ncbi:speckle-type POZ protein B [Nasonia vitripennis]|uniref:BTB domain-containing protein n=1 Tax=Nasonia vitripennis TaxID=7425 RepID=A0A7M7QL75_NASVI|nr:speckle-type POZ protein B [Nasonia vitripennis]